MKCSEKKIFGDKKQISGFLGQTVKWPWGYYGIVEKFSNWAAVCSHDFLLKTTIDPKQVSFVEHQQYLKKTHYGKNKGLSVNTWQWLKPTRSCSTLLLLLHFLKTTAADTSRTFPYRYDF